MSAQPIAAIYQQGYLRLLTPVDLAEGQEVAVLIVSAEDRVVTALGDLLAPRPATPGPDLDEAALAAEIERAFLGQPPLSETLIAERRTGP